jgi:hypothetical protein
MDSKCLRWFLVFAGACGLALSAIAMSSTEQVAWSGKLIQPVAGWPDGTLKLINDASRTDGWNHWFSQLPNDVNHYGFVFHSTEDLSRVMESFAAIKSTNLTVSLDPNRQAASSDLSQDPKLGRRLVAVLALGNQTVLDGWYKNLKEVRPGVRKFGVHEYIEPPVALTPTFTLYVGNPVVDLEKVNIPPHVKVQAYVSDDYRKENGDLRVIQIIDDFVAKHRAKQLKK